MYLRTDSSQLDFEKLRLMLKSWKALVDESMRKICHYQQHVPQHYYLLGTLVVNKPHDHFFGCVLFFASHTID